MRLTSPAWIVVISSLLVSSGCNPSDPGADAGSDAGLDAGPDAGLDPQDAGSDAGIPGADGITSGTIGFRGGSLRLIDGATVTVPVGALTTDVDFTFSLHPGQEGQPPEYVLEPAGTTFARPATISLPFTGAAAAQGIGVMRAGLEAFEHLGGTVEDGQLVAAFVQLDRARVESAAGTRSVHGVAVRFYPNRVRNQAQPSFDASSPPRVFLPDASGTLTPLEATLGPKGTFFFTRVPHQAVLIQVGTFWTVTHATAVDLGIFIERRLDVREASPLTALSLNVEGLLPWDASSDNLSLTSSGTSYSAYSPGLHFPEEGVSNAPAEGATALVDYTIHNSVQGSPWLIEGDAGDRLLLTRPVVTGIERLRYVSLSQVLEFPPFNQIDGATTSISGTFTTPPRDRSLSVRWRRSQFYPLAAQIVPSPVSRTDMIFGVEAVEDPEGLGMRGNSYSLFYALPESAWDGERLPDLDTGTQWYPEALPGRELRAYSIFDASHSFLLPGTIFAKNFAARSHIEFPVSELVGDLKPQMGPPLDVRLDGQLALVSTLPLARPPEAITWSAPSLGTATTYTITLHSLAASEDSTISERVGLLSTDATSIRLPPGLMLPGHSYVVVITAYGPSPRSAAAPRRKGSRLAMAETLTGLISIAP